MNDSPHSIRSYKGISPKIGNNVYIDPMSTVIGDVELGDDVSLWPMVVVRGDVNKVKIGARSNIQDGTVIHETRPRPNNPEGYPTIIGEDVTVGHKAMLHGCTIKDRVLVGIGAIVLDGAIVNEDVIIGAGSLVAPGKELESGYLYMGSPAKPVRALKENEIAHFKEVAQNYIDLKKDYTS